MRQIILDTETTGLSYEEGHRIIEIGCVELIDRRYTGNYFHEYFNPEREVEAGALAVHGITNQFLADKPLFKDLAKKLIDFINGAELIIHNAPFDVNFLNCELQNLSGIFKPVTDYCSVLDTLVLARRKHPGQQNSLDALCRRYQVDNSHRDFHGALLDAKLLAEVYLSMTGGQVSLFVDDASNKTNKQKITTNVPIQIQASFPVIYANPDELAAHQQRLQAIQKTSGGNVLWYDDEVRS